MASRQGSPTTSTDTPEQTCSLASLSVSASPSSVQLAPEVQIVLPVNLNKAVCSKQGREEVAQWDGMRDPRLNYEPTKAIMCVLSPVLPSIRLLCQGRAFTVRM